MAEAIDDDQLEVFFGQAADTQARVYAELSGRELSGLTIAGTVRGPTCEYARTLPASYRLRDLGPGRTVLAEAVIPEPCFWTPTSPHLYTVNMEIRRGSQVIAQTERMLGIRPLDARGKDLMFHGRRWVLRGVLSTNRWIGAVSSWREAGATMVAGAVGDSLCREASRLGVLLVASVRGSGDEVARELRRLSRWPAVGIASLSHDADTTGLATYRPKNLLLGQYGVSFQRNPAPWADVLLCDYIPHKLAERASNWDGPVIAIRDGKKDVSIEEARAECDVLQRDLAPYGDFAGYIVIA